MALTTYFPNTTADDLFTALDAEFKQDGAIKAARKRGDVRRNKVAQIIYDLAQNREIKINWADVKERFMQTQTERAAASSTSNMKAAYAKSRKSPDAARELVDKGKGWRALAALGNGKDKVAEQKKALLALGEKLGLETAINMLNMAAAIGDVDEARQALESLGEHREAA